VPEPKTVKNRLHLDVFVEDIEQACSRAEALGGQRLTERTISEYGYEWHVVADPEGNELCFVTRPP
jgi:predicted enzyme related to lactoylglutathione lyase